MLNRSTKQGDDAIHTNDHPAKPESPSDAAPESPGVLERPTRRDVLGRGTRKAFYVTPFLLSLSARQALAMSGQPCGSAFKYTIGSPCAQDGTDKDCCPPLMCHKKDGIGMCVGVEG